MVVFTAINTMGADYTPNGYIGGVLWAIRVCHTHTFSCGGIPVSKGRHGARINVVRSRSHVERVYAHEKIDFESIKRTTGG